MKFKISTHEDYRDSGTQIDFNEDSITFSEIDGEGGERNKVVVPIAHAERMLEILSGIIPAIDKLKK